MEDEETGGQDKERAWGPADEHKRSCEGEWSRIGEGAERVFTGGRKKGIAIKMSGDTTKCIFFRLCCAS